MSLEARSLCGWIHAKGSTSSADVSALAEYAKAMNPATLTVPLDPVSRPRAAERVPPHVIEARTRSSPTGSNAEAYFSSK